MSERLPAVETEGAGSPALFLHGFGGSSAAWSDLQERLSGQRTIAFDLPGHGAALGRDDISTAEARNAVLGEIDRIGEPVHLVGHSRGGAIACLVAMKVLEKIASLTLLAPGGFGEEIAGDALAEFAKATGAESLKAAMTPLYAPVRPSKTAIAEQTAWRTDPRAAETLIRIREGMMSGGKQGMLRLDALADAPFPIAVVWGEEDAVVPVFQARALTGAEVHVLPGLGHMLMAEAPEHLAALLRSHFRDNPSLNGS